MLDKRKINVKHYAKIHGLLWRSSPRLKSGGFRADFIFMIFYVRYYLVADIFRQIIFANDKT